MWNFWLVVLLQLVTLANILAFVMRKETLLRTIVTVVIGLGASLWFYSNLTEDEKKHVAVSPTRFLFDNLQEPTNQNPVVATKIKTTNINASNNATFIIKEDISACAFPLAIAIVAKFKRQGDMEAAQAYLSDPARGQFMCKTIRAGSNLFVEGHDQREGIKLIQVREKGSADFFYIEAE